MKEKWKFKKVFERCYGIGTLDICDNSYHNLAAEVPKIHFPNRMVLFLYGTSDVDAVDSKHNYVGHVNLIVIACIPGHNHSMIWKLMAVFWTITIWWSVANIAHLGYVLSM